MPIDNDDVPVRALPEGWRIEVVTPPEPRGVWITYYYAPYEGCSEIVPHASAEDAARFLSERSYPVPSIKFVAFGEELPT